MSYILALNSRVNVSWAGYNSMTTLLTHTVAHSTKPSFMPKTTDYGHPMKAKSKETWKFGPMWQTKYAAAIHKNLGVGVNFRPCSEGYFLSGRP